MTSAPRLGWATRAGTATLLVIYGLLFLWLLATSLKTDAQIFDRGTTFIFQPTFANYRSVVNGDLLSACLNSAIIAWGEFLYAITFLADPTHYPISVLIGGQIGMYGIRWSNMVAIAVAASLPILAIYAFTHRLLRDGLALGSVR